MFVVDQLTEVVHDNVCAMMSKLFRARRTRNSDHQAEFPAGSRLNARDRVFDDDGSRGRDVQKLRGENKAVRGGFTGELSGLNHCPVDLRVEVTIQLDRLQQRGTVFTRRHDRQFESVVAELMDQPDGSFVSFDGDVLNDSVYEIVLTIAEPGNAFDVR